MDSGGHPRKPATDDSALRRCMIGYQAGEKDAFVELYQLIEPQLRAYLSALCLDLSYTDDLVQETFLAIHRSRQTYRPRRPFKPWAFAIARYVYLMHRRSSVRRRRRETACARSEAIPDEIQQLGDHEAVMAALIRLSPEQRECVVLHHALGVSFSEIGSMLGIRPGTAKVRAHRGMNGLRQALGGE